MHETKQFAAHIIDNAIINTIINITPPSVVFLVASDGEGLGEEEGRGEVNEEEKTDEVVFLVASDGEGLGEEEGRGEVNEEEKTDEEEEGEKREEGKGEKREEGKGEAVGGD